MNSGCFIEQKRSPQAINTCNKFSITNTTHFFYTLFIVIALISYNNILEAQVNTVTYGKNVIQHKKLKWKFCQSPNFNTCYYQGGLALAKYVSQVAEEELPSIEKAVEHSLPTKSYIVVYNSFEDYQQTNIGLGIDWQNGGGVTKFANNKIVIYFNGNHNDLRIAIRQGIAKAVLNGIIFGENLVEFATNQALLDLPDWYVDGYVSFIGEHWNTQYDDNLKNLLFNAKKLKFQKLALQSPQLIGHAFWYYVALKYGVDKVTNLMNLTRTTKSMNKASERVCLKKLKPLLAEMLQYFNQRYEGELKGRKNAPKAKTTLILPVNQYNNYYKFQANPNLKINSYAFVKYRDGVYKAIYVDDDEQHHLLLKTGVRTLASTLSASNYPLLAWDPSGTKILVMYAQASKIVFFVYDVLAKKFSHPQVLKDLDQVTSVSYMLNDDNLLMSAVKNGQSEIYTYQISAKKLTAITDDKYDNLQPAYVALGQRVGIIWSSNRPSPLAFNSDTSIPSRNNFNIFFTDISNPLNVRKISQVTKLKQGNATLPSQYDERFFTFVSDENGIKNRWAGQLTAQVDGLDTVYFIGTEVLTNPAIEEIDEVLKLWKKDEADSIRYFQVYKDTVVTFPLTNYQTSLLESQSGGKKNVVSEVRREGNDLYLYKLTIDEKTIRSKSIELKPTIYMQELIEEQNKKQAIITKVGVNNPLHSDKTQKSVFQTEFQNEILDSLFARTPNFNILKNPKSPQTNPKTSSLFKSRFYNYKWIFNIDYLQAGVTTNIIINKYQPYQNGSGPILLNTGAGFNLSLRSGISDLFEDYKIIGGIRYSIDFVDKDFFISFQDYKSRVDWGLTYYRSKIRNFQGFFRGASENFENALVTNLYQGNIAYPIDKIRSIRFIGGLRIDKGILRPFNIISGNPEQTGLSYPDTVATTFITHLEYVHDNSINPAMNIWKGLRWKVYGDLYSSLQKNAGLKGIQIYNIGFDVRYYVPLYRNLIWALRAAGDASFGKNQFIYYLGGVDGWVNPKFISANTPSIYQQYAFQTTTVNLRGYNQNLANGNNAMVMNSEIRLPIFPTILNGPINSKFVRNLQLVQFIDLGTAWAGSIKNISRPTLNFISDPPTPVVARITTGGIGPFAGGYGFGLRTFLLGYFMKLDMAWPMDGFFNQKPKWYFALGLDF
ncbi:MAG: hypothetical protein QM528_08460 [Phycisphaerales bacterium]|nr:hypothetical protein [Phycisphaerales bacterium]